MLTKWIAAGTVTALFAVAGNARAALVTWEFEAISRSYTYTNTTQAGFDAPILSPGHSLRGSLTLDTATPVDRVGTRSTYAGAITSVTLEASGPGYDTFPLGPFPIEFALTSSEVQITEFTTATQTEPRSSRRAA